MTTRRAALAGLGLALFAPLLQGCASGPAYDDVVATLPPVAAGKGRLFIYRTDLFNGEAQPSVMMDGSRIGDSKPYGFYYVDVASGPHVISTTTEVSHSLSLDITAGTVRYVRLDGTPGMFVGHIWPVLVDEATAKAEMVQCKLTMPAT